MGVVSLGPRVVRRIDIEKLGAVGTAMLRVREMDLPRPPGDEIPDIVQHSCEHGVSKAGLVTAGTRPLLEITAPSHDLRFGQIVRMGDPFRGIWQILTGSRHSKALLGLVISAPNLRDCLACVMANLSVMMLQTPFVRYYS